MHLDSTERSAAKTSPMQIAHNPLFTAREKIELLNRLKAEVADAAHSDGVGFDLGEIDAAIEEVRLDARDGARPSISVIGARDEHIR